MAWASCAALGAMTSLRSTSGTTTLCSSSSFPAPFQILRSSMFASQSSWSVMGTGKGGCGQGEEGEWMEDRSPFAGVSCSQNSFLDGGGPLECPCCSREQGESPWGRHSELCHQENGWLTHWMLDHVAQ